MAKFRRQALIESLQEKVRLAQEADARNVQEYTESLTRWEAEIEANVAEALKEHGKALWSQSNYYGFSSIWASLAPPYKPSAIPTSRYTAAIKQLEMMDGDVIEVRANDDLLKAAL